MYDPTSDLADLRALLNSVNELPTESSTEEMQALQKKIQNKLWHIQGNVPNDRKKFYFTSWQLVYDAGHFKLYENEQNFKSQMSQALNMLPNY